MLMKNKILSKAYGGVTVARHRLYGLGLPRQWKVITSTLLLLFTFAIGNVWAADPTHDAPATKTTGGKTYIDAANTPGNAGDEAYINYGVIKMDSKKDDWAWFEYGGTWSKSNSGYSLPTGAVGFCTPGSSSSSEFYGKVNFNTSSKTTSITIYFTGTTEVGFIWKNNNTSNNRWIVYTLQELKASDGTDVGDPSVFDTHTSTSVQYNKFTSLDGTKYYKLVMSTAGASSSEFYGFTLKKYVAPATKYTATYKAGEGTGDDVVDSDAKTVKAFADCSFTAPSGYEFKEWQDGSSNVVAAGATVSADMTLTAIYRLIPTKYTVTYSLNGASGDAPTETDKAEGDVFNLAAAPSWAGHAFDGWLCSADAAVKAAGASYTMTAANTTFTAQWHEVDCKIYSLTGGIGSAAAEADAGNVVIDASSLVLKSSNAIIKLTPGSGTFKAGDILTISGTVGNTSKNFGVKISASNNKGSGLGLASVAGTSNPMVATATLSADADYLYICRDGGTTQTLLTCEVHRSCAEGTAAGLSYAEASVNKYTTDAAFTNPLTNTNNLVLDGYKSSNEEVATVNFSTGEVTIVGEGSATITANSAVQTKAGTLYAAGTASYTLTVAAPPTYAVTYAKGDESASGEMTDPSSPYLEGAEVTLLANTFTAPSGQEFDAWVVKKTASGDPISVSAGKFTMPAEAVTVTATWRAITDKYTVKYMDGETELGTEQVIINQHPTATGISTTKPFYNFASWQLSGSDVALSEVTSAVKDVVITLTARWAKAYATSYDMEAYAVSEGASKAGLEEALTAAGYAYTNINGIDNGHTHNYTYDGMKYKTNDGDLSFNVVAGKVVEVKTGHLPSNDAVTMYINGVANATVFEGADEASETHKTNYFYSAVEALYRLEVLASKGTCSVKKITIRDPYTVSYNPHGADAIDAQNATPSVTLPTPVNGTGNFKGWYDAETEGNKIGNAGASYTPTANITLHAQWETVSSDNTLSDLQVDGATVAGFDPAVQIYNLVYDYGQQPVITSATATAGALATVTINNTPVEEATFKYVQVKVEAESGAERFYQVRYTNNPKQGATIFKAELTSNTAADYSGMYADGDNSEIKLADDGANGYKFSGTSNYVKMAIADATFAEGDMLKMTYTTNPQQGELAIYDGTTKLQGTAYSNHIMTFSDAADGKSTLFIRRTSDNNFNGWVAEVEIQRYMAPMIKSLKIGAVSGTIDQEHKTIAIELPYGTSLYGVAATIEAYANGGATVTAPTPLAYDTPLGYRVSSAYAEDGDVDYTLTITEADHYEAMIVGGANYETLAAAVAAAHAGDVVKLLDNVDLMATGLEIVENMTLDLNGFNIKAGEQIDNDILVPAGVKLTLVDNSTDADGKIYTEQAYTGAVTGYGLVRVSGELLMQSGNIYAVIDSDPANLGQFAVVLGAGGKATIEGGQIKAGWYAISNNGNNTGSTIIVSGGELISTADYAIYNPAKESTVTVSGGVVYGAAGGIAMNRGELTVTGGTITSKDQGTTGTWGDGTGGMSNAAISASGKYESVEVEISGGTIIAEGTAVMITNGTTNPVEVAISGGQFSHVVPEAYCAKDFIPVTTPNAQGKYEVIAAGIIRGAAVQDANDVYYYTLDNGVTIYSSNSEGQLNTSTMTSTSTDVTACGGAEGGYNVNKSAFVLKFPVNVKEFTLYGANSTERTISKIYVNAEGSKTIKISTDGDELTGTYTNTKDGKCQALTAAFNDANIIPANYYVLVKLDGSVNFYRVLYTEAECTTPTVTVADQTAKDGVAVNLIAEASALGATYQWYTCEDELGTNPVIMPGKTAKTLSVIKSGADDQFYKVVVGCNCSAEKAEAVAKVSLYTAVTTLVDVTENTIWDWTAITNDVDGNAIGSNGPTLNGANYILANYIQGNNMDKVEGNNGAFAIRSSSNKVYQGASLHMHTTKAGFLTIKAGNEGTAMVLRVANAGRDYELGALAGTRKDYTVYVEAGDVTVYNVPTTAGKPMRVEKMTFTVKESPDYTRDQMLGAGVYGTICVPYNVPAGGIHGITVYELMGRESQYGKLAFDEIIEMEAGVPYVFQAHGDELALFYGETSKADPVDKGNGMYGTFVDQTLTELNDVYYFAQKALWGCADLTSLNVPANRAYVKLSEVDPVADPNPAPGRRRISMAVNGEQIATGIENTGFESEAPRKVLINGELFIIRGEKMYDAKGQLVK